MVYCIAVWCIVMVFGPFREAGSAQCLAYDRSMQCISMPSSAVQYTTLQAVHYIAVQCTTVQCSSEQYFSILAGPDGDTPWCQKHASHCTLHTAQYTVHTAHCTVHCTLHGAYCTLYTAHCSCALCKAKNQNCHF